jgi:hypothetical protein
VVREHHDALALRDLERACDGDDSTGDGVASTCKPAYPPRQLFHIP